MVNKIINPNPHSKNKLKKRYIFEHLFRLSGMLSISFAIIMLLLLLYSIFSKGYTAFFTHYITIEVSFDKQEMFKDTQNLEDIDYDDLLEKSMLKTFQNKAINPNGVDLLSLLSILEISNLKRLVVTEGDNLIGQKRTLDLLVTSNVDMLLKGYISQGGVLSAEEIDLISQLKQANLLNKNFNKLFFIGSDSRYPELAGIKGAFYGSIYTVMLTIVFTVILSVGTAVYLQEFAPRNKFVEFIEVNINNLAAVPSIIFGLLGLILFQQFLGIPRSTPLLASFVLTLMALPTIIIASRISMSAVPPSIKEAAYGLGSSKLQVIIHHLLPISMPGILTGIILSISRIIGETAPLLMIGMVAFINTVPASITSNAVVFPVQILLWSDSPEVGYIEKASAAIMLLLMFLMLVNWISIYLRNKFEVKF